MELATYIEIISKKKEDHTWYIPITDVNNRNCFSYYSPKICFFSKLEGIDPKKWGNELCKF